MHFEQTHSPAHPSFLGNIFSINKISYKIQVVRSKCEQWNECAGQNWKVSLGNFIMFVTKNTSIILKSWPIDSHSNFNGIYQAKIGSNSWWSYKCYPFSTQWRISAFNERNVITLIRAKSSNAFDQNAIYFREQGFVSRKIDAICSANDKRLREVSFGRCPILRCTIAVC